MHACITTINEIRDHEFESEQGESDGRKREGELIQLHHNLKNKKKKNLKNSIKHLRYS